AAYIFSEKSKKYQIVCSEAGCQFSLQAGQSDTCDSDGGRSGCLSGYIDPVAAVKSCEGAGSRASRESGRYVPDRHTERSGGGSQETCRACHGREANTCSNRSSAYHCHK